MPNVMYQTLQLSPNTQYLSEERVYKERGIVKENIGVHHQKLNRDLLQTRAVITV